MTDPTKTPMTNPTIAQLIERSSLGTPEALSARARTPPEMLERFRQNILSSAQKPDSVTVPVGPSSLPTEAFTQGGEWPGTNTWLMERLRSLPVVPPAAVETLKEVRGGAFRAGAAALRLRWVAYFEARRHDAAMRLGMWLVLAGIGTAVVGLLGLLDVPRQFAWARPEVGYGAAVSAVGYYLGAEREHLQEDKHGPHMANKRARRHRRILAVAFLCLPVLALWTSIRFRPGPGIAQAVAKIGLSTGSVLAAAACLVMFCVLTLLYKPASEEGGERRAKRRTDMIRVAARCAGLACLVHATTHLVSTRFAPILPITAALIVTAGFLCLAASECFYDVEAYYRPLFIWSAPGVADNEVGLVAASKAVADMPAEAETDPAREYVRAGRLELLSIRQVEQGDNSEALKHSEEAVKIRENLGHPAELAASLYLKAVCLRAVDNRNEALIQAERSVELRETLAQTDPDHKGELRLSIRLCRKLRKEIKHTSRHGTRAATTLRLLARGAVTTNT